MVYLIRSNFKKLRIKKISKIIVLRKDLVKMKSSLKNPLISIIVPVFNVKNYIEKCVLSLINQTYKNIEIILVDDGSSDGSEIVCDKFQSEYKNTVKVIHQKNQGLSVARNVGLENASGEFVCFVDSDDYIEPTMLETLFNSLSFANADISICSFFEENENNKTLQTVNFKDEEFSNYNAIENLSNKNNGYGFVVVWNKLFKRNLFENITFPKNRIHEDQFVIFKLFFLANKFSACSNKLYHHVNHKQNISASSNYLKHFDDIDGIFSQIEFCKENNILFLLSSVAIHLYGLIEFYLNKGYSLGNLKNGEIKIIKQYLKKCRQFSKYCYKLKLISKDDYFKYKKTYYLSPIKKFKLKHLAKIKKSKHALFYKSIYTKLFIRGKK